MLGITARLLDLLSIVLGGLLSHAAWSSVSPKWTDVEIFLIAFTFVAAALLFPSAGIYQSWRGKSIGSLVVRVLVVWLGILTLAVIVVFSLQRVQNISREWVGSWAVASSLLFVFSKIGLRYLLQKIRREGLNQRGVVIVGSGGYCRALISRIRTAPEAGFKAICILDERAAHDSKESKTHEVSGIPVLSNFLDLVRMVRNRRVHEIWLALPLSEERSIMRYVWEFRNDFVDIRFIPDVRSLRLFNHATADLLGFPAINLTATQSAELEVIPKLIFDRAFAAVVLLMLLPLFTVIALFVKLSSPGPIFFKQKRKGVDGREFEIFKFRSMKIHAEEPGVITQAQKHDPRITAVGAFLRRTSLDELPQFINVLRGEMSVVGPRPHALAHDDLYKNQVDGYMHRYRIKPGITGWAQVNGFRGETDRIEKMEARVKYDLYYIQHWSFWFDIKIVFLTIFKGFTGRNAY